jgi:hypothetical protein
MDHDHEVASLAAETLALQAVISNVLHRIRLTNPTLADAVRRGFDDAADQIEAIAIQAGSASRPDHLVKSLQIVEQLRKMTLGKAEQPKRNL